MLGRALFEARSRYSPELAKDPDLNLVTCVETTPALPATILQCTKGIAEDLEYSFIGCAGRDVDRNPSLLSNYPAYVAETQEELAV